MTPQEQLEKKKRRALVGLAIGLMLGVWTSSQSYGDPDWIFEAIGACVVAPVIFSLIGGGVKGFAALFSHSG